MRKMFIAFYVIGFLGVFSGINSFADDNPVPATNVMPADNGSISEKLDKIMSVQTEILKQLEEVKAEVQITKIRASQR